MVAWRYEISLLVLKKYFTRSLRSLVKYFQHSKRNFVSPHGHVISSTYTTYYISYLCTSRIFENVTAKLGEINDQKLPPK